MKFARRGEDVAGRQARILVFGETKAGKSTFAASMPGPRLVLATEDNADIPLRASFDVLPREFVPPGEKDRGADVCYCSSAADVEEALNLAEARAGQYESVILDSLTALLAIFTHDIQETTNAQRRRGGMAELDALDRRGWGLLGARLQHVRYRLHGLPCHVCTICHLRPPVKEGEGADGHMLPGGPDIPGREGRRWPAACCASLYLEQRKIAGRDLVRVHTRPYNRIIAGTNVAGITAKCKPDAYLLLQEMGFLAGESPAPAPARAAAKPQPRRPLRRR